MRKVGACHPRASLNGYYCPSLSSSVHREKAQKEARNGRNLQFRASRQPLRASAESVTQKSQSSSSVASALPMTYEDPEPEKKSWFSSAFGESADRIAGFTFVTVDGNIGS